MSEDERYEDGPVVALPNPNDVLFPDRAPTVTFPEKGSGVTGTILGMVTSQQTEMGSGRPLMWSDGTPRLQVIVTLQTDENDPTVEDDDGKRRLFVKADMMRAIREAVKVAGEKRLDIGGELQVTWTDEGVAPGKGLSKPKVYEAKYLTGAEPF